MVGMSVRGKLLGISLYFRDGVRGKQQMGLLVLYPIETEIMSLIYFEIVNTRWRCS